MRSTSLAALLVLSIFFAQAQETPNDIPHLVYANGSAQLYVDGSPMLLCGGELGNSSASSMEYMRPLWSRFVKMHLNTLVAPVYWDLIQPREDRFDFSLVDSLIDEARTHRLKLVLLWFGTLITAAHDFALGWSPKAKQEQWPLTGGIIIVLSDSGFYVGGTGLVLTFEPKTPGRRAGILSAEEGRFIDGKWHAVRQMNGDQDHQGRHLRIPEGEYGIQRITLYTYQ
jgi:hypothetical protein